MAVSIAGIISGPAGTSGDAAEDSYDPDNQEITVPTVSVGATTYHNVVDTVGSLVSIGSVTGADTYSAPLLSIAAVLVGSTIYNNVVVMVGSIVSVGARDSHQDRKIPRDKRGLGARAAHQARRSPSVTLPP